MVVLDGKKFLDKEKSFEYLNTKFAFSYYVENLDALYDCLSMEDFDVEIINYRDIFINLGQYGRTLLGVFLDLSLDLYINLNLIGFGEYHD
ncbi:MAG: barstar family protein [Peptoniphilaceae bacterium]|nr:barstar family protein [Peptoniphilaceae bacterium]MDY6019314.1 barstar family protein [Anaerococcus sp.]